LVGIPDHAVVFTLVSQRLDIAMVTEILSSLLARLRAKRALLFWLIVGSIAIGALTQPRHFVGLWLTPDQQGRILFQLGYYGQAAKAFQNPLWKGMSFYAAEEFEAAATLFSQYPNEAGLLAQANAWAHSRNYLKAMERYRSLLKGFPTNSAAPVNMPIIQALIEANQRMSESQATEMGDLSSSDDEGPKSSEGDEREMAEFEPRQQLTAEELLQDPHMTELWMRQVNTDPSRFLSIKFHMQLEQREKGAPSP
jgi:Ca-activated chloride channel family protein